MCRTEWLKKQLRYWGDRTDLSAQRLEELVYMAWAQIPLETLCKYTKTTPILIAAQAAIEKRDLINRWIENLLEDIGLYRECIDHIQEFPYFKEGKIAYALWTLSFLSFADADTQLIDWHADIQSLFGLNYFTEDEREEWVKVLDAVSDLYYEKVANVRDEDMDNTRFDYRETDVYKANSFTYMFERVYRPIHGVPPSEGPVCSRQGSPSEPVCEAEADDCCCICLEHTKTPCVFVCRHQICRLCASSYFMHSYMNDTQSSCPLCREPIVCFTMDNQTYMTTMQF
jgi:hypothetical protein